MGVHGLWELLAPVGHRVSNDNVRHKTLAVDISIWLTQFVKAMRDAEGAQIRNAHLVGVFRRCVKLLYLSVKPVLIFDGATPALKRRELSSRRAQREKHAAKLRRLAEKMLLNRIKQQTVSHIISKRRKGKLQTTPRISKRGPASSHEATHDSYDHGKYDVECNNEKGTKDSGGRSERVSPSSQKKTPAEEEFASSNAPIEDGDHEEMHISLPENVEDLDDEVLMRLPTGVQKEVFKQIKLEQRARHRESMMLRQEDPSAFSKMQIEGFLRHTALNRKISRVRSEINSKSGASQRIASDSGRNFLLEEGASNDPSGGMLDIASDGNDILRRGGSKVTWPGAVKNDLLANIRAKKNVTFHKSTTGGRSRREEDILQDLVHKESGTGWASRVLQDQGSLTMDSKALGSIANKDESNITPHADDIGICVDKPFRKPEMYRDKATSDEIAVKENEGIGDDSISDDDDWEDGDKPAQNYQKNIFDDGSDEDNVMPLHLQDKSIHRKGSELPPSHSRDPFSQNSELDWQGNHKEILETFRSEGLGKREIEIKKSRCDPTFPEKSSEFPLDVQEKTGRIAAPCRTMTTITSEPVAQLTERDIQQGTIQSNQSPILEGALSGGASPDLLQTARISSQEDFATSQLLSKKEGRNALAQTRSLLLEDGTTEAVKLPLSEDPESSGQKGKLDPSSTIDRKGLKVPTVCSRAGIPSAKALSSPPDHTIDKPTTPQDSRATEKPATKVKGFPVQEGFSNNPKLITRSSDDDPEHRNIASKAGSRKSLDQTPLDLIRDETGEHGDAQHFSVAQLKDMQDELEQEARKMRYERSSHQAGADSVADEMYAETRDLIKLFGIPYLEAPMEAEAQCAFLNKEGIVDGVLTEDSDAFLFGALTVYRNLFSEGRFAEAYDADDVQQSLGLDRNNLIRLAYLLGSDYTSGVRGVGIVNSMEILEAFPGSSGLEEFRKWTNSVTVLETEPTEEAISGSGQEAVRRRFCWKHRNMKRNWEVRAGFPNPVVFEAYINPVVDKRKERFQWQPINFEGLAEFCWEKFGWEKDRFEGAIGPLRKKLQESSGTKQRRIDEFFKPHRFAKIRSERLQRAVNGMAGDSYHKMIENSRGSHEALTINAATFRSENGEGRDEVIHPE